jgi:hypothetical protein
VPKLGLGILRTTLPLHQCSKSFDEAIGTSGWGRRDWLQEVSDVAANSCGSPRSR